MLQLIVLGSSFEPSTAERIVRMFRTPPPDTASQTWLLACVAAFLGLIALAWFAGRRREKVRRRSADDRTLSRRLSAARLNAAESQAFEQVVQASGRSALDCATAVDAFDQGVGGLLKGKRGDLELHLALRTLRRRLGLHRVRRGAPLRSTRALPPNQPVLVMTAGPSAQAAVPGLILAATEESLTIQLEHATAAARALGAQETVEVVLFRPGDASYSFRSPVLSFREVGLEFLILAHPEELTRIQKRRFVRVEIDEHVEIQWIPAGGLWGAPEGEAMAKPVARTGATITNLSASGLLLRTALELQKGDLVVLALPFLPPPLNSEMCTAHVVIVRGGGLFGLLFRGMSLRVQAALIQYVRRGEAKAAALSTVEAHAAGGNGGSE